MLLNMYPLIGRFILQSLFIIFFVFPLVMVVLMALLLLISFILSYYDGAFGVGFARVIREEINYRDR